MKYIYVYSNEKFDRNADNETVLRAWKDGNAERYTPEEFVELTNDEMFCDVTHWVRVMDEGEDYFAISRLHKDDLEHIGYDTSRVDDCAMKKLASKLGDDYCEQLFWGNLPIIADALEIPKRKDVIKKQLAVCGQSDDRYALERNLDRWWGQLGFDEMKRITGLDYRYFSPEDGYQEYVDVSDNLWRNKSFDDKLELYNTL
jgi:hypothetical protein